MKKSLQKRSVERKQKPQISKSFIPEFWANCDGRLATVKQIKRRLDALRRDSGADNTQLEMLCQRAVFLSLQLETMEQQAARGEDIPRGTYTQMSNALMGLLKALGLDKGRGNTTEPKSVREYVQSKEGDTE